MKKIKPLWLSFDLGIKGDYEGIYEWLDKHDARECGDSFAFIKYKSSVKYLDEIKKDLIKNVQFNTGDRVYIVYRNEKKFIKGHFIIGNRKPAPWRGYAQGDEDNIEDF